MKPGFGRIAAIGRNFGIGSIPHNLETPTAVGVALFFPNRSVIPSPVPPESFSLFRQARPPAIILVDPAIRDMKYPNTRMPDQGRETFKRLCM